MSVPDDVRPPTRPHWLTVVFDLLEARGQVITLAPAGDGTYRFDPPRQEPHGAAPPVFDVTEEQP